MVITRDPVPGTVAEQGLQGGLVPGAGGEQFSNPAEGRTRQAAARFVEAGDQAVGMGDERLYPVDGQQAAGGLLHHRVTGVQETGFVGVLAVLRRAKRGGASASDYHQSAVAQLQPT